MPNKLGLSTPEMPDTGPEATGFPTNVRNDLRTLASTAERRGTVFPAGADLVTDGDKFYRTDLHATFEYHADSGTWIQLAQGDIDPTASLNAHRTLVPIDHPDNSVTTAKLAANAVTTAKLAANAATDAVIGNRTIDQSWSPLDNAPLTAILGAIAGLIRNVKGTTDWKTAAPITLTGAKAHVDAPAPHSGHETPGGAQTKVNAHNTSPGSHGVYSGAGGAPTGTGYPVGSLYRDLTYGHLYEYLPTGWKRVGMNIKSVQRGSIALAAGSGSGTAAITAVAFNTAVCLHNGNTSEDNGQENQSSSGNVSVQLANGTTVQAVRANSSVNAWAYFTVVEYE